MTKAAIELLGKALQLNADQLTASLKAMSECVYKAGDCGDSAGASREQEMWTARIDALSQSMAHLKGAQSALQTAEVAAQKERESDAAVVRWVARMFRHGVTSRQLKQQTDENVAIVADLVVWKAKDAMYADSNNPWRAVLGIYKDRVIARPTEERKAKPSKWGTPKLGIAPGDLGDYLFGKLFARCMQMGKLNNSPTSKSNIEKDKIATPTSTQSLIHAFGRRVAEDD